MNKRENGLICRKRLVKTRDLNIQELEKLLEDLRSNLTGGLSSSFRLKKAEMIVFIHLSNQFYDQIINLRMK